MAVEIGALRALLSLDSAAFEKGAKRAQASMNGLQRSLTKAAGHMQKVGRTMSTRVTAPFVAATGLMVRSSLSTIDAQAKFAQSLGTTTSSIQALTRAADMAGISQGDLEGSLRRMTRRISLAEQGAGAGAKAFARLGIEAADLADLDAAERIKLIQERIAAMVPAAEQAAVASQVFGDKTGLAMLRLDAATIDKATDEIERFGVSVSDVDADSIEEANDAMSALGLVTQGLGNQMAVALAPALKSISEGIADVSEWFSGLSPRMKTFVASVGAAAVAIGPMAVALGFVATGLAALASPIGLAVLAFGAVAGAVAYVAIQWDSLVEKYPVLQTALDTVGSVAKRVWEIFSNTGKAAFEIAVSYIELFSALLRGDFKGALEASQRITDTFVSYIRDTFPGVVETITQVITDTVQAGRDIIASIGEGIREKIASVGGAIDELVTSLIDWIKAIPGRVADAAREAGQGIFDSIKRGVAGASAQDANGPLGQMRGVGADISEGLAEGIRSGQAGVEGAAADVANAAEESARDVSETRSPSQAWMRLGADLMSGLGIGISDNAQAAAQSAADAAKQVTDATGQTLDDGSQKLSGYFDSIGSAVSGAITQGQDFGDAMRGVFQRIASDFISSGISDMLSSVFGAVGAGGGLFGGAAAPAFAGNIPTGAYASFDGGGYTGAGSRTGGIDGKGGFVGILHPNETVIDHTKGGGLGAKTEVNMPVNINNYGAKVSTRRNAAGGLDIDVEQAIDDYFDSGRGNRAMKRNYSLRPSPKGT
ncbi:hypothetical protein [Salipiger bermudensis]|uniref:hypothetical protein n=1 Tax=Salipiger bermudensis TaxID=344736 RepID=UPI001A8FA374|nr:hypothetical protein [Salipiger bermudensis]MBN9674645.1 hypothetical protein [Salipiger bermudensis]